MSVLDARFLYHVVKAYECLDVQSDVNCCSISDDLSCSHDVVTFCRILWVYYTIPLASACFGTF